MVFGDITHNLAILGLTNAAFATYNLTTSIGPLPGTPIINSGFGYATTTGSFILTTVSSATFQAAAQSVPEPSSLALLGLGVAALTGWRWRKHGQATQ